MKYECIVCKEGFKSKQSLIDHLEEEWAEADRILDDIKNQCEELGIKNLF